ncbi:MAG: phospho-sugar mutase [Christensenellaceae bacterium]|nr:phospho-sugar mutase [Christensenellaceae bacterium]
MNYQDIYKKWLGNPALTEDEKAELNDIKDDVNAIKDRFGAELEFGTAGMRGVIGAGTNRMNAYTVARATRGLAKYIISLSSDAVRKGVVIAYDTRRFSTEFAIIAAEVLNSFGIRSYLFENVRPVPVCSFTVRHLGAAAGIMITASHNPKVYNGYKVYGADGAQMSPEDTAVVVGYIEEETDYFAPYRKTGITAGDIRGADGKEFENVTVIGKSVDAVYFNTIEKLMLSPDAVKTSRDKMKIIYTPIHGSGYMPVTTMLERMRIPVETVPEQIAPDPDFSTVRVPNPEEADALSLAVSLAEKENASVVIGTDPDCDRMGVAVRDDEGKFVLLNGNQTGVLLMDYILRRKKDEKTLPENAAVVKTIVSTRLADCVAKDFGVTVFDVLTGFKFIGEKIKEWEENGKYTFVFGFEESYGCLAGTHARDKDAVVASMLFAEMACYEHSVGSSVYDRLKKIYEKHGFYLEKSFSFAFSGIDAMDRMAAVMDDIRKNPPEEVAGRKVLSVSDYLSGVTVFADKSTAPVTLPKSNVLYFALDNDAWICVRPSGTEPKLKIYVATKEKSKDSAERDVSDMKNCIVKRFGL